MQEELILICSCYSFEHQAIFWKDKDKNYNELYVYIHLASHNFWRRITSAIKYIFGYTSRFGEWDEFIFKEEDIKRLKEFLDSKYKS